MKLVRQPVAGVAGAVAQGAAALDHEVLDHAMKNQSVVVRLALGIDRDAGNLAEVGDERDAAVLTLLRMILEQVQALRESGNHIKVGICGQAPSDYPEVCQLLVEQGIDSISLSPDVALKTTLAVLEMEKSLAQQIS